MKRMLKEDGQVLVTAVCSLGMLLGLIGLAVDVSMLFRAERQAQIAADAGAIAGALELHYNGSTNVQTNAVNAAEANGVTAASQVAVSPNGGGYHTGTGFVQVVITKPNPTIFLHAMSVLALHSNNWGSVNVGARAVAGVTPDPSCIYLLDPTVSGALSTQGASTVNSSGCGIEVNSNSSTSVCITGGGNNLTFNAPYVRLRTTDLTNAGNCNGNLKTPTFSGAANVSDPLGGITGPISPSWSGCDYTSAASTITAGDATTQLSGYHTICFSSFVQIGSGTSTVTLNNANAYVFEKGVEIMPNTTVNASGTFDIAGGTQKPNGGKSCIGSNTQSGFLQDSSSLLNITAPSSGFSQGIALMEPSGDTTPLMVQFGSNSVNNYGAGTLSGLIYAPSATVYLHDNGGGTTATGLISDTLSICSSTLTITSYNNSPGNSSPLNSVQLVE